LINRPYGIGNGLIGDGAEPDESGPSQTHIAKILLGDRVSDIVTSPNNSVAYAALTNSIAVISSLHDVSCIIPVSGHPRSLRIDADGSRLFASNYCGAVSVIDLASFRVTPIALGDSPLGVSMTPDGLQAYVASRYSLSVIDTVVNEAARIAVGDLPRCVRVSPDGKYAYVSNFGDRTVSVIDTIAQCVTETIEVGGHPEALAVSPDGHRLYVGDCWSGTVTVLSVQP
jgi:YVTN family beta-propeller protein